MTEHKDIYVHLAVNEAKSVLVRFVIVPRVGDCVYLTDDQIRALHTDSSGKKIAHVRDMNICNKVAHFGTDGSVHIYLAND